MSVLNFAHGGLFAWGAYAGVWFYAMTSSFIVALIGAVMTGALLGFFIEKLIIKPVYGDHVKQILITLGLMIVLSELLKVVWGPNQITAKVPPLLAGSWEVGNVTIIKYRLFIIVVGLIIFSIFQYILKQTKIGLIVRAGVINKEMVQALGINIKRVILLVFIIGSLLAGSWEVGNVIIIKYRLFIIVVGLIIFSIFQYILKQTKIGLIVRAGVINKEMVQALGINIKRVFLLVFIIGSALAAFGGGL